ncbi:hypothetical protein [Allostella humosa]|uniref:hypothetical protein n=1 Tax=Stella humosa TaxID=94 RepID=UPI000F4B782D|nr:hypothetical protein [Stella humosa]
MTDPAPLLKAATGVEIAKATALFPLIILAASVCSSWLTQELMQANKITLSIAGFVALFAVLDD